MVIAITLKLADIEKGRIFTTEKGVKLLDLVLMDKRDGPDQYGQDGFVAHSVSKEERSEGERGKIVGNWKWLVRPDSGYKPPPPSKKEEFKKPAEEEDDQIPF